MSKPSLNKMALAVLRQLHQAGEERVTARSIRDQIGCTYGHDYPIQTIIVVLSRFCQRGLVNRCTVAGPEARQRYQYYLASTSEAAQQELVFKRFQAFADELFEGDLKQAFFAVDRLLSVKGIQQPELFPYHGEGQSREPGDYASQGNLKHHHAPHLTTDPKANGLGAVVQQNGHLA